MRVILSVMPEFVNGCILLRRHCDPTVPDRNLAGGWVPANGWSRPSCRSGAGGQRSHGQRSNRRTTT